MPWQTLSYPTVILERDARFIRIRRLHENELVFPYFVEDSLVASSKYAETVTTRRKTYHIVPCSDDTFHIEIAGEERHDPIRYNFAVFDEDAAEVTYNGWIVPDFKARAYGHLVTASSDDLNIELSAQSAASTLSPLTNGKNEFRVNVMGYDSWTTGVN